MIDKIIDGFNGILQFFSPVFDFFSGLFSSLFDLLQKPLELLFHFLDGIFYFFAQLFTIVVLVVKIFVALFQYIGALIAGVFRQIRYFLSMNIQGDINFPSESNSGFAVVFDILKGTGILSVVPIVATAFLWFFFVLKMISLFGGNIYVKPFGRGD
jgi:phage-related protein